MPDTAHTSPKPKRGCLKTGCSGLFVIVALVVIVAAVVAVMEDETETKLHTLLGDVIILNSANFQTMGSTCAGVGEFAGLESGATMTIAPEGDAPVTVPLGSGYITSEGNCRFDFTATIPNADAYEFSVGSRSQERLNRTVSKGIPEGFIHESADASTDPDSWWVSIQWDMNE